MKKRINNLVGDVFRDQEGLTQPQECQEYFSRCLQAVLLVPEPFGDGDEVLVFQEKEQVPRKIL